MENKNIDLGEIFQYIINNDVYAAHNQYRVGQRFFLIIRNETDNSINILYKNHSSYARLKGTVAKNIEFMLDSKYKDNVVRLVKTLPFFNTNCKQGYFSDEYTLKSKGITISYSKTGNGRRPQFRNVFVSSRSCGDRNLSPKISKDIIKLCEKITKKERDRKCR